LEKTKGFSEKVVLLLFLGATSLWSLLTVQSWYPRYLKSGQKHTQICPHWRKTTVWMCGRWVPGDVATAPKLPAEGDSF
jgi:hypothetical protein